MKGSIDNSVNSEQDPVQPTQSVPLDLEKGFDASDKEVQLAVQSVMKSLFDNYEYSSETKPSPARGAEALVKAVYRDPLQACHLAAFEHCTRRCLHGSACFACTRSELGPAPLRASQCSSTLQCMQALAKWCNPNPALNVPSGQLSQRQRYCGTIDTDTGLPTGGNFKNALIVFLADVSTLRGDRVRPPAARCSAAPCTHPCAPHRFAAPD
jgi:hypothetical protein